MTVANQSVAPSLVINIDTQSTKVLPQWKLQATALVHQIWWRVHAYSVVFKVMLLTLGSLVFLYVHWMSRNVLFVVSNQDVSKQ
ncbi:hypothetical protein NIES4071_17770 [Calothrix sp. NIES-4071]|nr:hypothetical protein NIES4071_17770 [Calothrix sp. NIES-4071]BAZ56110.1 hypothetical protein NIES4105_17720 [Calothrix sp. NIES-4105]